jgi:hypothetical protein
VAILDDRYRTELGATLMRQQVDVLAVPVPMRTSYLVFLCAEPGLEGRVGFEPTTSRLKEPVRAAADVRERSV